MVGASKGEHCDRKRKRPPSEGSHRRSTSDSTNDRGQGGGIEVEARLRLHAGEANDVSSPCFFFNPLWLNWQSSRLLIGRFLVRVQVAEPLSSLSGPCSSRHGAVDDQRASAVSGTFARGWTGRGPPQVLSFVADRSWLYTRPTVRTSRGMTALLSSGRPERVPRGEAQHTTSPLVRRRRRCCCWVKGARGHTFETVKESGGEWGQTHST